MKIADGELALAGQIIVRQRGTRVHPGRNVRMGGDDTLYAIVTGKVKFTKKKFPNFHGVLKRRVLAHIKEVK